MPGIAGFLTRNSVTEDNPFLEQMFACMKHDASYVADSSLHPDIGAFAGIVSRPQLQQRAWNPARNLGLLLYGESHVGSACSRDALQTVLADFETNGILALQKLNGWFSGLLLDLRKGETILFNDRFGLGRVYCHENGDGLLFSSEAKSILSVVPETRRFDERGLGEWLSCGCVLQNRTLFNQISLLPPGSAWIFSADGILTKRRYFDPSSWESQTPLSTEEYVERFAATFPHILKKYVQADDRVGMSLTGGIDGRMIMAWAKSAPGTLPCYTFNGPIRDCADVVIARKVAVACNQSHQALPLESDFFSQFGSLAEQSVYITDGAMDVTGAAELYMNRKARQIAPIRLTGNYGSEIVRRYVAFRPRSARTSLFNSDCLASVNRAAQTYAEESKANRLSFIAFKQVPWHHHARFAVEQSQLTLRSPYLDNDLVSLVYRAPEESAMSLTPSLRIIANGNAALARIPTDRGITYPNSSAFNKIKREWHEFLAKAEYAYDYGMPDRISRIDRVLSPLRLERLFLGRQKFCHFRSWYRNQLAGYVREVLLDPESKSRSYLNGTALELLVEGHIRGTHNRTVEIHKLLSLELIQRQLFESTKWKAEIGKGHEEEQKVEIGK